MNKFLFVFIAGLLSLAAFPHILFAQHDPDSLRPVEPNAVISAAEPDADTTAEPVEPVAELETVGADTASVAPDTLAAVPPPKPEPLVIFRNVGEGINTDEHESSPVISPDGKTLYFWSTNIDGYGFQDVYVTRLNESSGEWSSAQNVGPPVNNADANLVLSITPDGRKLLIYRHSKRMIEKGYSDLAIIKRTGMGFTPPKQIKILGYKNPILAGVTAHLASDDRTLILSYEGEDSNGLNDLYVSFYNPDSGWYSKPKNLGNINTGKDEITPFLAADGMTLYFSSSREGGKGGYDVYRTQRLDTTWQNWSPAINLGEKVNTDGNEMHFKFPLDAERAYMVTTATADTNYGGKDIYSLPMPEEHRPTPVVRVEGKVIDQDTKSPLSARIVYLTLPEGESVGSASSDEETGEYTIFLPKGKNYAVLAQGKGYIAVSENLNTTDTALSEAVVERDLVLAPMKIGSVVRMNNLFFKMGKAELEPASYPELNRLVFLLNNETGINIEVGGHTDAIGDDKVNNWLSRKRAEAIMEYLVGKGIAEERITAVGYGSKQPVAENNTAEGRSKNRRVEIKITQL